MSDVSIKVALSTAAGGSDLTDGNEIDSAFAQISGSLNDASTKLQSIAAEMREKANALKAEAVLVEKWAQEIERLMEDPA